MREGDRLDETGPDHLGGEALMIADFLDAIRSDRPPLIDTRESARSTAAVICAELSATSGERMAIPDY